MKTSRAKALSFIEDPQAVEEAREQLRQFPTLHLTFRSGVAVVLGTFPLIHEGEEFDRYALELVLASDHPYSPPMVFEVGGRIPRIVDRHTLNNEALCLGVLEQLSPPPGQRLDIGKYLNTHVRNYLLGNTLVELGKPWPFGELPHGVRGILQYYAETYGLQGIAAVRILLSYALHPHAKGHWDCFCGSNKRMRDCHPQVLANLRKTTNAKAIQFTLDTIKNATDSDQSKAPA